MTPATRTRISLALLATAGLAYAAGWFYRWSFPPYSTLRALVPVAAAVICVLLLIAAALVWLGGEKPLSCRVTPVDDPSHTIRLDAQGSEESATGDATPTPVREIDDKQPTDAPFDAGARRAWRGHILGQRPYWSPRIILLLVLTPAVVCLWLVGAASVWYPIAAVGAILLWVFWNFTD